MKFKVGDIVVQDDGIGIVGGHNKDGTHRVDWFNNPTDQTYELGRSLSAYTGPIYEKDGQRFVPSGEFRLPEVDEWAIFDDTGWVEKRVLNDEEWKRGGYSYMPILLPVPEVAGDPFLDGTREITDEDLKSSAKLRCKLCDCGKSELGFREGNLYGLSDLNGNMHYYHYAQNNPDHPSYAIAVKSFVGDITWAEDAKENIRVVL